MLIGFANTSLDDETNIDRVWVIEVDLNNDFRRNGLQITPLTEDLKFLALVKSKV